MGVTKTEKFTSSQNQLAALTKALGHPARIAILQHLLEINSCICGDLVSELPLSQATVSQHLRALKDSGLIQGNIDGTSVCYCINPEAWTQAKATLNELFDQFEDPGCC